jgi:photosystem II stability/assembly factor-like uncharacterized protein
MKHFYSLLFLPIAFAFLLQPIVLKAQWTEISPSVSDVIVFDVTFISNDIGFAVGQNTATDMGYIFKTTDGGANWTPKTFPNAHLRTVAFTDEDNGVVAGYDGPPGTHIKWFTTNDQGGSWAPTTDNIFTGVNGIQFIDGQTGFAFGYGSSFGSNGGLLKSTDAGFSWTHQSDSPGLLIEGMHFMNANTGFISAADFFGSGSIQKTTNGGATFVIKHVGDWMRGVTFVNSMTGFAIEGLSTRTLIKTTDGGETWNTLPIDDAVSRVKFITEEVGYAIGKDGTILKTTNGGSDWVDESPGTTENFEEISVHGHFVYVCGRNSKIYKSDHGVFTGINNAAAKDATPVVLFPNPVLSNGKIQISGVDQTVFAFTLINAVGQKVVELKNQGTEVDISSYQLSEGVYVYRIETETSLYRGRLVIN